MLSINKTNVAQQVISDKSLPIYSTIVYSTTARKSPTTEEYPAAYPPLPYANAFTDNGDNIDVTLPGDYTLTVTDDFSGCTNDTTYTVIQDIVQPTVDIAPAGVINCTNPTLTLDGSGSTTNNNAPLYTWLDQSGATIGTQSTVDVTTSETFTLVVVDSINGCYDINTVTPAIDTLRPVPDLVDNTICLGNSATLIALEGTRFIWSTGETTPSITVSPTVTRTYSVIALSPNGCNGYDTATVNVIDPGVAVISGGGSICTGDSARINITYTGNYLDWDYEYTDGTQNYTGNSTTVIASNWHSNAGTYTLVSVTANGCPAAVSGSTTIDLLALPTVSFYTNDTLGCTDYTSNFVNTTTGNNSYVWYFGNGDSSVVSEPSYTYTDEACYDITLQATDMTTGCINSVTRNAYVCAVATPVADMSLIPEEINPLLPVVTGNNDSRDYTNWEWRVNSIPSNGATVNIDFISLDTDTVYVQLFVDNSGICFDTIDTVLTYVPEDIVILPNAFTPNEDGQNDFYAPLHLIDVLDFGYEFVIYNRWGEKVFYSQSPGEAWDGKYMGEYVQEGVYVYLLKYKTVYNNETQTVQGHVTVLR